MQRRGNAATNIIFCVLLIALSAPAPPSADAGQTVKARRIRTPATPKYGGGSGTLDDPFLIYTAEHLNTIGIWGPMDAHFKLMADINLSGYRGAEFRPSGGDGRWPFRGTFDGNGHTISNLTWDSASGDYVGLFGVIDDPDAEIRDLYLVDPNICIQTGRCVGALAGRIADGVIRNCVVQGGQVTGGITGVTGPLTGGLVGFNQGDVFNCHTTCEVIGHDSTGGLVGENWNSQAHTGGGAPYAYGGRIIDCSAKGDIRGHNGTGGLVGLNWAGLLRNCHATGSVTGGKKTGGLAGLSYEGILSGSRATGNVTGDDQTGGLIGETREGALTECCATGHVGGNDHVGGLIGDSQYASLNGCYSTATVSGREYAGGLLGSTFGRITNSYALGDVNGVTYVGGLIGRYTERGEGIVRACYSAGQVCGESHIGGLLGDSLADIVVSSFWDVDGSGQAGSDGGKGVSSSAMQESNTFQEAGWDFVGPEDGPGDVWDIDSVTGYPVLWWQVPDAPLPDFAGGNGTPEDPYRIASARQLNSIGDNPRLMDACFVLDESIDLTDVSFFPIGSTMSPFSGVFDGKGQTIANLSITADNSDHVGLLGYVDGPNAKIRYVGLIDPNIDARTSDHVGGMIGRLAEGTIAMCHTSGGSVVGNNYVGGLVGSNSSGIVAYSFSTSAVIGWEDEDAVLQRSDPGGDHIGGLIGSSGYLIGGCYATGTVDGRARVGGLAGSNDGTIRECYAVGPTFGSQNVGGLTGYDHGRGLATVASFWDTQTTGQFSSAGGQGMTTAQMQRAETFSLWGACDNEGIWTIDEGKGYPKLWWEPGPGQPIAITPLPELLQGSGTPDDPYLIYTGEEMNHIGLFPCQWDKHFALMADIDLSAYNGTDFNKIGDFVRPFSGVFDGNGYIINNFTYSGAGEDLVGIFAYVSSDDSQIRNVTVRDPNVESGPSGVYVAALVSYLKRGSIARCRIDSAAVSGYGAVGALVGYNYDGCITDCRSSGRVSGDEVAGGLVAYNGHGEITDCNTTATVVGENYVGGLAGYNYAGQIINCQSDGIVRGSEWVGGLTGANFDSGRVTRCYSTAPVSGTLSLGGLVGVNVGEVLDSGATGSVSGGVLAGGFVGINLRSHTASGVLRRCYATGVVKAGNATGGLVGRNHGTMEHCLATGSVTGGRTVGGLAGSSSATIASCFATGMVTGTEPVGGLVGHNQSVILHCYATGAVSGTRDVGGLVGYHWSGEVIASFWDAETTGQVESRGGIGLTTAEMMTASTFLEAGWDFVGEDENGTEEIWWILEGEGYPRLWWEAAGAEY